jgi:uncharacterized damage-inducible protein DinB
MAMNWTGFLKQEIDTNYKATLALLDKVDGSNLAWKPQSGSNWMTMGELLKHLTEATGYGCKAFITGDWTLPDGRKMEELPADQMMPTAETLPSIESVDDARKLLTNDIQLALKMVEQAGEDDLSHRMVAAPWAPNMTQTVGWMVHQMIQHLNQHKGQLFYYLKLQGKPVSTPDLWGAF